MRDEPSGERFRDRDHPYADDLDMFGPRSLFQLLSSCRTPMGEQRLASWLLHPSPIAEIRERQSRIAALRGRIDLRERIAVVNAGRRRSIQADRLIAWAEEPPSLPPIRIVIVALALMFVAALAVYMNGGPGIYVGIVLVVNLVVFGVAGEARQRDRRKPRLGHRVRGARSAVERDQGDRARDRSPSRSWWRCRGG